MRTPKPAFFPLVFASWVGLAGAALAQTPAEIWQDVKESALVAAKGAVVAERTVAPRRSRTLRVDRAALGRALARAPRELTAAARTAPAELSLPMPDGTFARFAIEDSPIAEPGLEAKFPEIKTYLGRGLDDPTLTARLDQTPQGFHAIILAPVGSIYIDPYWRDDPSSCVVYWRRDFENAAKPFSCLVDRGPLPAVFVEGPHSAPRPTGAMLRTYRTAVACTGEYAAAVGGGTVNGALGAIVTTVNRVSALYERDFAIRLKLVSNTDLLVFTNAATDGFTNDDAGALLGENQTKCDTIIGNANYDLGHVFSTGGGGLAYLGVVGESGFKAGGVTGTSNPVGDPYDIDYVAHEMGHQFGGNHPFNGTSGSCSGGNRNASTAYEVGSGTTIMAYAGICSPQNLAPNSDDYFHTISYNEIDNYTSSPPGNVGASTATGNSPPVIAALANFIIPSQTPFALTASATDPNATDVLTYCWEEFDLGPAQNPTAAPRDNGSSPIFRSFAPSTSPTRTFPSLTYILSNANVPPASVGGLATGEFLPTTQRTMTFRVTVRDNRAGGGGSNYGSMTVTSTAAAGPFATTSFETASTIAAGSVQTLNWNVANTNAAPISCANVKISLSTDGGRTFPFVLAASTPNDGTQSVTIPNTDDVATTQGRFKVEAVGSIFFDISGGNTTITSGTNTAPAVTVTDSVTVMRGTPTAVLKAIATATDTNNPLTATITDAPAHSTISASITGSTVTVSALAECSLTTTLTSRTYPVTLTVTDSLGASTSRTFNFIVQPNPSPSVGDYSNQTVVAGSSIDFTPAAPPADANNNLGAAPASVNPTTLPGGGTIGVDQTTGVVTVNTSAATTFGTYLVRATIQDTCGAAAVKSFNVTVSGIPPVNSPPTITGAVAGRTATDKSSVAPFPGVTIADVDLPAQTQAVSVALDVAAKGSFTTLNGFTSAGGGVYTFSGTAAAATTAIRGLVFAPTPNRVAPGTTETTVFTISANDGVAPAVTNNVTTVISTSINDAPVITGQQLLSTAEDTALTIALADLTVTDPDHSYPTGFTLTVQNGANYTRVGTTITPAADFNGPLTVPVTVHDGLAPSASFNLSVNVTAVNDPPTLAAPGPLDVPEDAVEQTVNLAGISTGAANEIQTLTVTATSSDPSLIATPTVTYASASATGALKFTPAGNRTGQVTITVTVDDGQALDHETSRSFVVNVTTVNDPPSFTKGADQTLLEDAGPQVIAGWATALSPGPADEAGQTLSFVVSSTNPGLFASAPAIAPNGTLSFTPAADANGSATVTVQIMDNGGTALTGADTSAPQTFAINVTGVNDAPSFAKGADFNLLQSAGAQTVPGWATAISAGGADESGQTLIFTVTTSNDGLFSVPPAISPTGTLAFTPAPAANGAATVTVVLRDNGGMDNNGADASAAQTFVISTTAVNDPPTFALGADQSVPQEAGLQTVANFATNISPGPADEAAQLLDFQIAVDHPELFATPPTISTTNGTLSYTPAATASGTAVVTVRLHDNGASVAPDVALSAPQTFKIAVTTFAEEPGTYHGLALPSAGAAPGADKTGLLKLTLSKKGTVTGKLKLGAFSHSFKGTINNTGVVTFGKTNAPTVPLKRKAPLTNLILSDLRVDVAGGSDTLAGIIKDGAAPFATIGADRALYTSKQTAGAPFMQVPAALLGKYTVLFDQPLAPGLPANGVPRGDGYGVLQVRKTGVAKLTGKLADGTKISSASALSKLNFWPLWSRFAKGTGALAGPVHFQTLAGPNPSDLNGLGLHWFKPAQADAERYPNGWPAGITTDLLGSTYRVPPKEPPASVLPGLSPVDADGNAKLTLTDGNLPLPDMMLSKALKILTTDKVFIVTEAADELKVSLTAATGLLKGSFIHPRTTKRVKFQGVLFQAQQFGSGYFLGPTESGAITLIPAATPGVP